MLLTAYQAHGIGDTKFILIHTKLPTGSNCLCYNHEKWEILMIFDLKTGFNILSRLSSFKKNLKSFSENQIFCIIT